MKIEHFGQFDLARTDQINQKTFPNHSHSKPNLIPCVRGRSRAAAQLMNDVPLEVVSRQNSLQSNTSYASSSSWFSQTKPNDSKQFQVTLLPSELPYLSVKNPLPGCKKDNRSSWQSYIQDSLATEERSKEVGAFFTTLAQQHQLLCTLHDQEDHGTELASSVGVYSDVSSSMSGYTDCNSDDIVIWKKLEKALNTKIRSINGLEKSSQQDHQKPANEIPLSLQIGQPCITSHRTQKSRQLPGRFSEPPSAPIPPLLAPRPTTLLYQYQRVTAAGSAAQHRRNRSGTDC